MSRDDGSGVAEAPGVPEALPRVLRGVGRRLGPEALDRIWLFPPMVRGRREWGLVAASTFVPGGGEDGDGGEKDRRRLYSAPYSAERTGAGLHLEVTFREQGEAPPDRLPRIMDGVVRRAGTELGDPREVEVAGEPPRFQELLDEFDPALFEEPLKEG